MLDIRFIRENQSAVEKALNSRCMDIDIAGLIKLDDNRKHIISVAEELKFKRNSLSKKIGQLIKEGQDTEPIKTDVRKIGEKVSDYDKELRKIEEAIKEQLLYIPNMPSIGVPIGKDEADNPVVRSWGELRKFDFAPKPHWEIGENLGLFDLERGAKIAGSGFPLFTGVGAKLERALIQFMLDVHTIEHGYHEVAPPFFCNQYAMTGTGQLPKFAEDMYTMSADGLYAIPTAEVPVTNLYADEILERKLPILPFLIDIQSQMIQHLQINPIYVNW